MSEIDSTKRYRKKWIIILIEMEDHWAGHQLMTQMECSPLSNDKTPRLLRRPLRNRKALINLVSPEQLNLK